MKETLKLEPMFVDVHLPLGPSTYSNCCVTSCRILLIFVAFKKIICLEFMFPCGFMGIMNINIVCCIEF